MKKIALSLSVLAMAMGFTACDNFELPNPPAQSNPQEAPVTVEDITIAPSPVEEGQPAAVLDLKAYNDLGEQVPVGVFACENWPASYNMDITMFLAKDAEMNVAYGCPAVVDNGIIYAQPDLIQAAYQRITKDPRTATVFVGYRIAAVSGENGTPVYIGGHDYLFGKYAVDIKPFDAAVTIEDAYYLNYGVDGANKVKMTHSDKSQYDDPVFTVVVEIPADEAANSVEWFITPESGSPVYGSGSTEDAGTLVAGQKGATNLGGPVMFTINMETLAYEVMNAYEYMYTPGASNGWSPADSNALTTGDYMNYSGFANLDTEFKFCATLDWSKPFGYAGGGLLSTDPEAGDIPVTAAGCYHAKMSITALTYELAFIDNCGVIGDATPGGWDAQTNLEQDPANPMIWKGTVKMGAGEWKIRFNDNWDVNLGGDALALTEGGANIASPGEGDYDVELNLTTIPYTCTMTKK